MHFNGKRTGVSGHATRHKPLQPRILPRRDFAPDGCADIENCAFSDLSDTTSKLSYSDNGYQASVAVNASGVVALAGATADEAALHSCPTANPSCQRVLRVAAKELAVAWWAKRDTFAVGGAISRHPMEAAP